MANIYDTANQMAADLKENQQFQEVKQAYDLLKLDAMGWALYQQFQEKQSTLQQQQAAGQEVSQEDMQALQDLGSKMDNIQPIQALLAKEQVLFNMMDELNRVIAQPIIDLYQPAQNGTAPSTDTGTGQQ